MLKELILKTLIENYSLVLIDLILIIIFGFLFASHYSDCHFEESTIKIGMFCLEFAKQQPSKKIHIMCSSTNIFNTRFISHF